jgi:hypothetical protein
MDDRDCLSGDPFSWSDRLPRLLAAGVVSIGAAAWSRARDAALASAIAGCARKAGGAPVTFADVPTEAFVVTRDALATFRSSEIAERGFCAACGTPLTYRLLGGHTELTLDSFDLPNAVAPIAQDGVESRVHWIAEALAAPATRTLAGKKISSVGARQHPDHET